MRATDTQCELRALTQNEEQKQVPWLAFPMIAAQSWGKPTSLGMTRQRLVDGAGLETRTTAGQETGGTRVRAGSAGIVAGLGVGWFRSVGRERVDAAEGFAGAGVPVAPGRPGWCPLCAIWGRRRFR